MKKTARGVVAALAAIALLCLPALAARAADPPGFEIYVVRHGDTLSKIAGRTFGDVQRWREILKANPQVKNANLIFPGDTLLVPIAVTTAPAGTATGLAARSGAAAGSGSSAAFGSGSGTGLGSGTGSGSGTGLGSGTGSGEASSRDGSAAGTGASPTAGSGPGAGAAAATAGGSTSSAAGPARPRPVVSASIMRSAGYFADTLPTLAIIATQDMRLILGSDDAAIINAPVSPGTKFSVVRADRRVFHPRTGVNLGWLMRVLGTAEVTCGGERTSTVRLSRMRDAGGVGDYLVPLEPPPPEIVLAGKSVLDCLPPGCEDGMIVAFDEDRLLVGEQDLAFIDRGAATGAVPGQVYIIYRESYPGGPVAVGELQVLRTGERTAAALITTSVQEVLVGDLLRVK